jgi:H+/Cl- antiporter ClcA
MWKLIGSSDYLVLGTSTILRAFSDSNLIWYAPAAKVLFTSITLGAGFIGGEVTPLFFIGATLGNVVGRLLGLPLALSAGIGMVSIFGAAANVPVTVTIMAVELMGINILPHVVIVVLAAFLISGHANSMYFSTHPVNQETSY